MEGYALQILLNRCCAVMTFNVGIVRKSVQVFRTIPCYLKLKSRSPIVKGFGRGFFAVLKFTG